MTEGTAQAPDGVAIHYVAGGRGDVALLFVHGWLGTTHWWDEQLTRFAPSYAVVALDLAGHGASGSGRARWSVPALAGDVCAVADHLALERIVLVGHSMSGVVIVEAARALKGRVAALIPVDSLHDAEWQQSPEERQRFFGDLRRDFRAAVRRFFGEALFPPTAAKAAVDRVLGDALSATPEVAVPLLEGVFGYDVRDALTRVRRPIRAINSDRFPTNRAVNRRYAPDFDVVLLPGSGHWPMLEHPEHFDRLLATTLQQLGLAPSRG